MRIDIWQFIAGVGLFLFAMRQMETGLKSFGGRALRNFFKRHTGSRLKSIAGGLVATSMLQSSSLIGLLVLAFVAAGMMTLEGALGVVFGSNLGTTLTGWLVATLGFKLDIDSLALPLVGLGCLTLVGTTNRLADAGRIVAAVGFLLLGLGFMKESVSALSDAMDVNRLAGFATWQYLAFGLVFAAVVQSSSATMMVTLAALHADIIMLPSAAAVVIGADLGTTTTVIIGAMQGAESKKRVAAGHVMFNVVTESIAFVLLHPLLALVAMAGVSDPLFALVAFHSAFNLLGLLLFFPFIGLLAGFLERFFKPPVMPASRFINQATPEVSDAALTAIEEETARLIRHVIRQNMDAFPVPLPEPPGRLPVPGGSPERSGGDRTHFTEAYHKTKRLEGEIVAFSTRLQAESLEEAESERLAQLLSAVRQAVRSAKSIKDVHHNLEEFDDSPRPKMNIYGEHFRTVMTSFYARVFQLRLPEGNVLIFEDLAGLLQQSRVWHDQLHSEIYGDIRSGELDEMDISSLLNVNRELHSSNVALLMALKDFHLDAKQAEAFGQLPGVA